MSNPMWTVQRKMLLPTLLAVVAVVIATAVTWNVSQRAAQRLRHVQQADFPVLQFHQDLLNSLKELHLQLLLAAATEDFVYVKGPDGVHARILATLRKDATSALGPAAAQALETEVEAYYAAGRSVTARCALVQPKIKRALAGANNDTKGYAAVVAQQREIEAQSAEAERLFAALYGRVEAAERAVGAQMVGTLSDARALQQRSILIGAAILLLAGAAAASLAWFTASRTSRPLRTLSRAALQVAGGDLTRQVAVETGDEVGALAESFRRMVTRLRELVRTLKDASADLAAAADELNGQARAQSAALERQAAGVAETSATTTALQQTATEAAHRAGSVLEVARRAAEMSDGARGDAESSAGALRSIQGTVEGILAESGQLVEQAHLVGDIVETVRELAQQSHVLSLNASIEAAHAGAAGQGFAVVAQEVRSLADQSGSGAARIAELVEGMLRAAQSAMEATQRGSRDVVGSLDQIRRSGDSLREIGVIVRESSEAALQIGSALTQQSTGIGQIAQAMQELDGGMAETTDRIQALGRSAQRVAETAARISGVADQFTV